MTSRTPGPAGTRPDELQLRRAALTVGLRIAVAIAVMVIAVIVAAAIYMLYLSHHPDVSRQDPHSARVYVESNDMLKAMAVAGLAGILAAGAIGWLSARNAIRPLGRALELQRRFVQDASHELRTPLAILDARVQLAQDHVAAGTEAAALLAQVRHDTAGLAATVQELLLAATGDPGSADAEPVDVNDVVAGVTADFQDMAAGRGIRLEFVHTGSPRVRIQPNSLRRAVLGLVDNALTHTPEGGRVTVTAMSRGREAAITVADTGTGISGIDQDRVFDRFARTSEPSPGNRRSYGLGLALVREIAVAAGGRVEISSTGPRGTTMALTFPAVP
ncbi:HAMP domain-containing sensor histidine kinase [Arthrobacter sp. STN4]|uniref:sensor histidine kinase n=1 Tax=Arthrobacter sp. STN4 TaxID=2923276 RepID=UPI002119CD47|nr:HAMP domain-containing sensor histidine kinase [Arthrobacter sp. STN4]MCQ9164646.1 HAMP domain-containing histidine kinase [Arthrobacter sp. STN4]